MNEYNTRKNTIGHVIGWPFRLAMVAQQKVWGFASFLAILPLLDQGTSGRERNAFERMYEPLFEGAQKAFGR